MINVVCIAFLIKIIKIIKNKKLIVKNMPSDNIIHFLVMQTLLQEQTHHPYTNSVGGE